MKEFNLELAKKGYEVCTRNYRNARIISFDRKNAKGYCILALVERDGEEAVCSYTEKGEYDASITAQSDLDLVMKPMKHEGWVNLYKEDGFTTTGISIHPTKESAMLNRDEEGEYITTIKIEWEE